MQEERCTLSSSTRYHTMPRNFLCGWSTFGQYTYLSYSTIPLNLLEIKRPFLPALYFFQPCTVRASSKNRQCPTPPAGVQRVILASQHAAGIVENRISGPGWAESANVCGWTSYVEKGLLSGPLPCSLSHGTRTSKSDGGWPRYRLEQRGPARWPAESGNPLNRIYWSVSRVLRGPVYRPPLPTPRCSVCPVGWHWTRPKGLLLLLLLLFHLCTRACHWTSA